MTKKELKDILKKHGDWLFGKPDGVRADLSGAQLDDADLRGANLGYANLCGADLRDADLRGADLRDANLSGAKNVNKVYWNYTTAFYSICCPESGAVIG